MDVTKLNVKKVIPIFMEYLNKCDFYAFDQEMTGIIPRNTDSVQEHPLATPALRFQANRIVSARYQITQIGIALFKIEKTINATIFNFHTRPAKGDIRIDINTTQFLRKNNFDFNYWIDNALPYTSETSKNTDETDITFMSIFEAMVKSKKPLVAHNCFTDFVFLLTHLGIPYSILNKELNQYKKLSLYTKSTKSLLCSSLNDGTSLLTEEYATYKKCLNLMFPRIFDTKKIVSQLDLSCFPSGTYLHALYEHFKSDITVHKEDISILDDESPNETSVPSQAKKGVTELAHHAGYDAFMTGIVFLGLQKKFVNSEKSNFFDIKELFVNQLAIFRSIYSSNLSGKDIFVPAFGAVLLTLEKKNTVVGDNSIFTEFTDDVLVQCIDHIDPTNRKKFPDYSIADIKYVKVHNNQYIVHLPNTLTHLSDKYNNIHISRITPFSSHETKVIPKQPWYYKVISFLRRTSNL